MRTRKNQRIAGRVCARCGRILTVTERLIGELVPPAICHECAVAEAEALRSRARILSGEESLTARRMAAWIGLVTRAGEAVASRRLAETVAL